MIYTIKRLFRIWLNNGPNVVPDVFLLERLGFKFYINRKKYLHLLKVGKLLCRCSGNKYCEFCEFSAAVYNNQKEELKMS